MRYMEEFPHYDDQLNLPDGWVDSSWHNDVCPSFEKTIGDTTLRLWCDFKDPDLREVGGLRFILSKYNPETDELEDVGQSESLYEILVLITKVTA